MIERIVAGRVPRKHHIALRDEAGHLYFEECLTRQGFDGPYSIFYHRDRPHAQRPAARAQGWTLPTATPDRPLRKRHYASQNLAPADKPAIAARVPLLYNEDVVLATLSPKGADPIYFINGDGDDLFYIQEGGGVLRSLCGDLRFTAGDYVFVPRGLLHRFLPDDASQKWLSIELLGGLWLPKQWRNEVGQLRMDAPYCHRDFSAPVFTGPLDENIRDVVIKRAGAFHNYSYDHSPLDVVGWDGTVYPWVFPILNFQARVGLTHLPPIWHGTFAGRNTLVCSFVPRPTDFHPEAIPCPYPHSSVDCDEFIYYCSGNFTSRKGVGPGSMSHHPAGLPHGPHPGAYEKSIGSTRTDELAVMLDCYKPLHPTAAALQVEDAAYHDSFL